MSAVGKRAPVVRDRSWRAQGDARGFDELVVGQGAIHLESMGEDNWYLGLNGDHGHGVKLWFHFKKGQLRWANAEVSKPDGTYQETLLVDADGMKVKGGSKTKRRKR